MSIPKNNFVAFCATGVIIIFSFWQQYRVSRAMERELQEQKYLKLRKR
jgi:hypothetical protein